MNQQVTPKPFSQLSDKYQRMVLSAFEHLLMPDGTSVLQLKIMHNMNETERVQLFLQMFEEFPVAAKKAMADPEIRDKLAIALIRLDVPSAVSLWLTLAVKNEQWNAMAKALNALLPGRDKFKGGVLPCTTTMVAWCVQVAALSLSKSKLPQRVATCCNGSAPRVPEPA